MCVVTERETNRSIKYLFNKFYLILICWNLLSTICSIGNKYKLIMSVSVKFVSCWDYFSSKIWVKSILLSIFNLVVSIFFRLFWSLTKVCMYKLCIHSYKSIKKPTYVHKKLACFRIVSSITMGDTGLIMMTDNRPWIHFFLLENIKHFTILYIDNRYRERCWLKSHPAHLQFLKC